MPNVPAKMKVLLLLVETFQKTDIKLFTLCAVLDENWNFSQVILELLSLENIF